MCEKILLPLFGIILSSILGVLPSAVLGLASLNDCLSHAAVSACSIAVGGALAVAMRYALLFCGFGLFSFPAMVGKLSILLGVSAGFEWFVLAIFAVLFAGIGLGIGIATGDEYYD